MLLGFVKKYLRIDGSADDALLLSLIGAAKEYLINAGVPVPDSTDEVIETGSSGDPYDPYELDNDTAEEAEGGISLYNLAIALHVNQIYNMGADGDKLDRAMTSIILQIKDYGGGEF